MTTTPLFAAHQALGAKIVDYAGWQMPIQYAGVTAEHNAVRTAAGLFDVCHMGELVLEGPRALEVINHIATNDIARLVDGQAMYTCACNERGGILDDLIVYRESATRYLTVCNAANRAKMVAHFAAVAGTLCTFVDISDNTGLLAFQGPKALDVLERLVPAERALRSIKPFHFAQATLSGRPCTIARTGYTGEDGVEIFCSASDVEPLWTAILAAGAPFGVMPIGLAARDTLRLEARLSLYGNELDESTTPWEAGIGWAVKLTKTDFIGKSALALAKNSPPAKVLVGFEMLGRGIARHGYPIVDSAGQVLGTCTSGAPSPTLGKSIGLGYVPPALSEVGTNLLVDCRGKSIEARVVKLPFYKRAT